MTSTARMPGTPPPELFTPDQLEAHAARIAATHRLASNPRRARALLPQLDRSSDRLDEVYLALSAAAPRDQHSVGAEEWLRDNHHVVQDQVREVRQHLPRKYYLELPKLADGPLKGYPRVYLLARELIEHTAGRIDLDVIVEFAIAYQRTSPLSIGETWAVPIMVRLELVRDKIADRAASDLRFDRRQRQSRRLPAHRTHRPPAAGRRATIRSSRLRWNARWRTPVRRQHRQGDGRARVACWERAHRANCRPRVPPCDTRAGSSRGRVVREIRPDRRIPQRDRCPAAEHGRWRVGGGRRGAYCGRERVARPHRHRTRSATGGSRRDGWRTSGADRPAERLADIADELVEEMDFGFLFNRGRRLFSIGYNATDGRLDASFYDALGSEARLASFVAIATGQVSHEHWFKLGRSLTPTGHARALLSWSASMFEYFMPLLVMRAYPGTLLDETYRAVIARQMEYAAGRNVPWGISESAYNAQDLDRNYQYRAFGVPGLGLKRGLGDDLVIAPYASILAAPMAAVDVVHNLERMTKLGLSGRYGFYEAMDFTHGRAPDGPARGVVLPTFNGPPPGHDPGVAR